MRHNTAPKHNVNVVIPTSPRLPVDVDMLAAAATLAIVPCPYLSSDAREAHILSLIRSALHSAQ